MNHTPFSPPLNRILLIFCAFLLGFAVFATANARADSQKGTVLIRDTEIENMLKSWSEPVIKADQLNPDTIKFILVQSTDVNAFVAGGPNIFIFTGLLMKSESPSEVIGVIAHELGHIRGGHLIRTRGAAQNASYESMLGAVLGIGAAILTGQGDLGSAIMATTQSSAYGHLMAFSRLQESSADQSALEALDKAKMSPQGLASFMEKLEDQELLPPSQQNEYMRTHPLTRDRVDAIEAGLQRSPYKDKPLPAAWKEQHARMLAKLIGFITPEQVSWKYDDRDHSIPADYARAIASYRQNKVDEAIKEVNGLIKREPENPYFLELKGQMLFDFGKIKDALAPYSRAVEILPDAPLIRTAFAHALIESAGDNKKQLQDAITHLQRALKDEPRTPRIHRLLATAYGRLGDEPQAKLHLAEEALLQGRTDYAKHQAEAAAQGLKKGSNAWLRAQDILKYIEQVKEKN